MLQYEMKQRIIAVSQGPHEIREMMVAPGAELKIIADLQATGWTAFSHGRPTRVTIQQDNA